MKRFTSTEKWDKDWFCSLSLRSKCFWFYLVDKCDAAGVWEPNYRLASFQIGEAVAERDLSVFGDRVRALPCGKVWLTGFVEFQYGRLSRECKPHQKVFDLLARYGIEYPLPKPPPHPIPLPKGMDRVQEKEKEEDKEADKEKDQGEFLKGETVPPPDPPNPNRMLRLNRLFRRREASKWSAKELKAYEAGAELCPIDEFEMVEAYYLSGVPYLRKDLQTLLNNWNGEVDRARKWRENPNGNDSRNNAPNARPITGAEQRRVGIPERPKTDIAALVDAATAKRMAASPA